MSGGEDGPAPLPRGKLRFGQHGLYATGGALGLSPREVDRLSLWELQAMAGGFARANGASKGETLTTEDASRLGAMVLGLRKPH